MGLADRLAGRLTEAAYRSYERRLTRELRGAPVPRHVGVILDGNRRWARERGAAHVSHGHDRGADKIEEFLFWCTDAGVEVVTLWLLSTDNLSRPAAELEPLLEIIEDVVDSLADLDAPWRVRVVGALDVLPSRTAQVLKAAEERTRAEKLAAERLGMHSFFRWVRERWARAVDADGWNGRCLTGIRSRATSISVGRRRG